MRCASPVNALLFQSEADSPIPGYVGMYWPQTWSTADPSTEEGSWYESRITTTLSPGITGDVFTLRELARNGIDRTPEYKYLGEWVTPSNVQVVVVADAAVSSREEFVTLLSAIVERGMSQ
jgi:hypothetical protein